MGAFRGIFGIIGGVIAYFVIKQDDPIKAKNCLKLGIILLIIDIIFGFSFYTSDTYNNWG